MQTKVFCCFILVWFDDGSPLGLKIQTKSYTTFIFCVSLYLYFLDLVFLLKHVKTKYNSFARFAPLSLLSQ